MKAFRYINHTKRHPFQGPGIRNHYTKPKENPGQPKKNPTKTLENPRKPPLTHQPPILLPAAGGRGLLARGTCGDAKAAAHLGGETRSAQRAALVLRGSFTVTWRGKKGGRREGNKGKNVFFFFWGVRVV